MGLTFHFNLQIDANTRREAARLVVALRERTATLGMDFVEPRVRRFPKPGMSPTGRKRRVPRTFRMLCSQYLTTGDDSYLPVEPKEMVCFVVHPAAGSETAIVGLARYPKRVRDENGGRRSTELDGWRWRGSCKTQYASNPRHGGMDNFLRAHLSLVAMLDAAVELGFRVKVNDESGYWEHRDRQRLVDEVNRWNAMIAGFGGYLKDALEGEVKAEIFNFPNFEHLEARSTLGKHLDQ